MFAKDNQLLTAAAELCYYTVYCSALNIEELRRENGIEALLEAYDRCVSILSVDSKTNSLHYQVISHVTRCFEVACNSDLCKQRIITLPLLMANVCRVVYFRHTLSVSLVTSLAANNYDLQCQLVCNGVLWSLLLFCFEYDYTLEESGVESKEQTNQQQQANTLAIMSIYGCIALAGYGLQLKRTANGSITDDNHSTTTTTNLPPKPSTTSNKLSSAAFTYTQNAQNPLQQKKQLAITMNSTTAGTSNAINASDNNHVPMLNNSGSGSGTYPNNNTNSSSHSLIVKQDSSNSNHSERSNSDTTATTTSPESSVNSSSNSSRSRKYEQKYIVKSEAQNAIVKQMLDCLLTGFITQKLVKQEVKEVGVYSSKKHLYLTAFHLPSQLP